MPTLDPMREFRGFWLPNITNNGLKRLIQLIETSSPLLIYGAFTRAVPMGCLASHIAWNHPATEHLNEEAGIRWLTCVAGLNPATSSVILSWDRAGLHDRDFSARLLGACRDEQERRLSCNLDPIHECFELVAS